MKNKNFIVWAVAALMLLPVAALGQARGGGQGGGQGRGQGGMMMMGGQDQSKAMLIARKDVQKDLKISADQVKKLEEAQAAIQQKIQAAMENMRGGGGGGDFSAIRSEFEKMSKEADAAVEAVLTPEQKTRLGQIQLQMSGARALLNADTQKALGLSVDQKRKLDDLQVKQQDANTAIMDRVRNQEIDREQATELRNKNNTILDEEIVKVLTPDQTAKFEEMKGVKFVRDPAEDGRRGGGGGGN